MRADVWGTMLLGWGNSSGCVENAYVYVGGLCVWRMCMCMLVDRCVTRGRETVLCVWRMCMWNVYAWDVCGNLPSVIQRFA